MWSPSLLAGENAAFLDERYRAWLDDPASVDAEWRALFDALPPEAWNGTRPGDGPGFARRPLFDATRGVTGGGASADDVRRASRAVQLINAWRVRGHALADIDPLGHRERAPMPMLDPSWHGLTSEDLDAAVPTAPLYGLPPVATIREIEAHLRRSYAASVAAEYMNIMQFEQRTWVQERLETLPGQPVLTPLEVARFHRKACDAENLERLLHNRFPGTKRFSIEGAETIIPALDLLVARLAALGVTHVVLGMAHRGRLNTLVNLLEKPLRTLVAQFQDVTGMAQGSGDVKYHLGMEADVVHGGRTVHLSLTPNPSHLEAVDPVVEGRARALQDALGAGASERVVPLLIHGDAAFSGQGLVMETLNLSELAGYATGGTIHVIINNQIGFTTPPYEARSTPYCTDVARMLAIPILHVNGEDPIALAAAVAFAVDWRQRFHRDVVVDVYCYRKHGHNESDEPAFTQPLLYDGIRRRPSPRERIEAALVSGGRLSSDAAAAGFRDSRADLEAAADAVDGATEAPSDGPPPGRTDEAGDTTYDRERLTSLLLHLSAVPEGLRAHPKIARLLADRTERVRAGGPLDWALGEVAAFATLLTEGHGVRLSGQDSGRGTFSHRHAVLADVADGHEVYPLAGVGPGRFACIDSSLSEAGVLGFEIGYAWDAPDTLVLWEAQFGDFVNGAQVLVDQFLVSAEQKWGVRSGLVLLLPHGYEGQGPEHSSARLERFLQAAAEDNLAVMNLTTPAQLFHALRRQVRRSSRKPLILMTPKSGLRHADAVSTLDEFAFGAFRPVLADDLDPAHVRRVVLCSGRVWFDLVAARRATQTRDVALLRVEQLAPWPTQAVQDAIRPYGDAEVVWLQEEPRNMGAWPTLAQLWYDTQGPGGRRVRCIARPAAAAPATGSHKRHVAAQEALIAAAFSPPSKDTPP